MDKLIQMLEKMDAEGGSIVSDNVVTSPAIYLASQDDNLVQIWHPETGRYIGTFVYIPRGE